MRCMPRLLNVVGKEFGRLPPRVVVMVVKAALIEVMFALAALAALRAVMVAIAVQLEAVAEQKRRLPSSFRLLVLRAHANRLVSLLPEVRV